MKRTLKYFAFGAIVAAIAVSCSKELNKVDAEKENVPAIEEPATPSDPADLSNLDPEVYLLGIGAGFEEFKADFNTTANKVEFEANDAVLVYVPNVGKGQYNWDATSELFIPATGNAVAIGSNEAFIYYPYSAYAEDGGNVTFTAPAAIEAGSTQDLGNKVPMVGHIAAGAARDASGHALVEFKNLGAMLKLGFRSPSGVAHGETITKIELSTDNGNLTGAGAVTWDSVNDVPALAALNGAASIEIENISSANGHLVNGSDKEFYFFLPAGRDLGKLTVKAVYGKPVGEVTYEPYEIISRNSALTPVRSKIYGITNKSLNGFFAGGDGSVDYPYQIATADDFKAIATLANATSDADGNGYDATAKRTFFGSEGVHYVQTATIDFGNATLTPIGVYNSTASDALPFKGVYDGGDNSLSKFIVNDTEAVSTGLFEYVDGATLKNIAIGQCQVTGVNVTGILTGRCIGATTIEGCSLTGPANVIGRNSVGFIAHITGSTTVKSCSVTNLTVVTADSGETANNQGGVVGFAGGASSIESCSTSGAIQFTGTASGAARGGIVGKLDSTGQVKDCVNNAVVTNGLVGSTGGIAGQLTNGTIVSCANTANVSGTSMVGGIVGFAGFAGTTGTPSVIFITSCRTKADVSGTANCVAGIAGKLQNGVVMSGCYAEGNASTGTYDVAGLVGLIQSNNLDTKARVYVYDCIANMNVSTSRTSGACRTGGAVGYVSTTVPDGAPANSSAQYVAVDNCGVLDVTITAAGTYVGGFVGRVTGDATNSNRARIRSCYTLVDTVPGSAQNGGFAGAVENKAELRYDYFVANDSSNISADTVKDNYAQKTASEIQSAATCTTFNSKNYSLTVGSSYNSALGWAMTNGYPVPGALIALGSEYYK